MIFDGTGAAPYLGDVRVEDDRIAEIAAPGQAGSSAMEVDGTGKTLMPGLVEAHGHLSWGSSIEKIYHEFMLPPEQMREATWRNARVLLDHGFTSVYSAGALAVGLEPELKRDIEAGVTPGPRLVPSTVERSPEGEDSGDIFNGRGPEAMRGFVRHCAELGVKSVKLVISGENALVPGSYTHVYYTAEELAAAQEEAQRHGLWLAAHAYTPEAIRCLIPRFDGAILSLEWKEAIWDRYVTGAPRPRTPSEQQYSDRKLRSRR